MRKSAVWGCAHLYSVPYLLALDVCEDSLSLVLAALHSQSVKLGGSYYPVLILEVMDLRNGEDGHILEGQR